MGYFSLFTIPPSCKDLNLRSLITTIKEKKGHVTEEWHELSREFEQYYTDALGVLVRPLMLNARKISS